MDHHDSCDSGDQRNSITPVITDPSALQAERITLTIGTLELNGFVSQGGSVANFRNIQYAHISARWHEAKILDLTEQKGIIDATQWGPRVPQGLNLLHRDTGHLYPRLSLFDRQSEFECLNLNVYTPRHAIGQGANDKLLPVMVWIHGGSFEFGDGGCEADGQYLVRRSLHLDQPVIVVGINYRLGALGFFSSHELRQEARRRGDMPYSNLGFADQRLALQWVHKYISHFGGDGSRITLAGESAGAISVLAHMRGNVPVCQNTLLMSPGSIGPVSFDKTQQSFDDVVQKLGVAHAPDAVKLAALRSVPADQLQQLTANRTEVILSEDPEFFIDYAEGSFQHLSVFPPWLERVAVGDLKEENAPLSQFWCKVPPEALVEAWKKLYGDDDQYSSQVLTAYGLANSTGPHTQYEVVEALIAYTSDALFSEAVNSIAKSHLDHPGNDGQDQPKVYQYRFDQPDVLSPSLAHRNRVYHSMDNAFLFCLPRVAGPKAPEHFKACCKDFSQAAIHLINGVEPWEDVGVLRQFLTFHGQGSKIRPESEGYQERWVSLTDTPERMAKFHLGRELLWSTMALTTQNESEADAVLTKDL